MALFNSLYLGANALRAAQLGIEVAGNNIANAGTPGFIRTRLVQEPAPTQRRGALLFGLGVNVRGVQQQIDLFLEERFRHALGDTKFGEAQESALGQLETLLGELSDSDVSTALTSFFGSVHDVLNQPESVPARNLAARQGEALASAIQRLYKQARLMHQQLDQRVAGSADEINSLLKQVASLNYNIVALEGGGAVPSDAVGLRDQRQIALEKLAALLDTQAIEQPTGAVTVYAGGDYLVTEAVHREVYSVYGTKNGFPVSEIRLTETDSPLELASGELLGLAVARDEHVGGFLRQLDEFAQTLIYEFNKTHASGQGLTGHAAARSEFAIEDPTAPLDAAGLPFAPEHGSFQVLVRDKQTGLTTTHDIAVPLRGLEDDITLEGLAARLDAIDGLAAEVDRFGQLNLRGESSSAEFAFARDTSGVLAALGINTFFSGAGAADMRISDMIRNDPAKFAASQTGIGRDSKNAELLANFLDRPMAARGGASPGDLYEGVAADLTQKSAVSRAAAEGYRAFHQTLEGEKLALSGVSLDEEAIRLLTYQRSYQAAAKYIATVNEILSVMLQL